nr:MAG TPA: Large polyvalent protein associated domain 29 [Caudoviricetes sp.]
MKYFKNITTAEEIKKQFRAYCVSMHPDKGGDAEKFKAMIAEYNGIIKNFEQAKKRAEEEEEARKAAEEARKAAEEERKREEEEARKAAEALRDVIARWSGKLKIVKPAGGWIEKPSADYLAAVKYNIKQILNTYFPGVDFKVFLKNKTWSESAEIFWTDGPTVQQVAEVAELKLFISHYHVCDLYEDYGHDEEMKSTRAWREQYGQISADRFEFTRTFSELGKAEVMAKIYEVFPQFAGMTKKSDAAFISFDDIFRLCQFLGFCHKETGKAWADLSEEEREARRAHDDLFEAQQKICYDLESTRSWYNKKTSLGSVIDAFLKVYVISEETTKAAAEAAAAPVFEPKHGRTWQAIKKALGANVFCMSEDGSYHYKEISINEAAEMVAKGEKVYLGKPDMFDGERCIYGVNGGGAKVQQKRADKFAAVDIQISNYGYNSYKDVEILQFAQSVIVKLRQDAEEVEKQRKQWEEEQKNGKQTAGKADRSQKAAKNEKTAEDVDMTAAPAEGLWLSEVPGGVVVVGDQRTTYKNRKQIKAHGAHWNRITHLWEATTPEAVAAIREWFGMTEQSAADAEQPATEQPDETAQAAQDGAQSEETTASDEQQPATGNEQQSAADEPQQDETTAADAATCEQVEAVGALASALSFLVGAIVSATEKANEALKQAADKAAEATANFEAEHRAEERKEAAAILRDQIKKVSEQVASLSDTLAQMLERLNALESGQDVSEEAAEEPQRGATAEDGAAAQQSEETAQDRPKGGSGSGVSLSMLRAAAEDAQRLTMAGEYKRAALAELYALCACGVDVLDLIDRLKAMSEDSEPAEVKTRCEEVRKFAANRAEVVLTPELLQALYFRSGTEPGSNKAA